MGNPIADVIVFEPVFYKRAHYRYDGPYLAKLLANCGLNVIYMDYLSDGLEREEKFENVKVVHENCPPPNYLYPGYKRNNVNRSIYCVRRIKKFVGSCFFYDKLLRKIDNYGKNWILSTYDNGCWPMILLPDFRKANFVVLVHSIKFFSSPLRFSLRINSNVKPNLLRKNLRRAKLIIVYERRVKNELVNLGFDENNIYWLPIRSFDKEKYLENDFTLLPNEFTLSSIGGIRGGKNIEFVLDALKRENIKYILAGSPSDSYGKKIVKLVQEISNKNIIGKFGWLSKSEYVEVIKKSHFTVIADEQEKNVKGYGTLYDSLLNFRPVIVPNYPPFDYYINKYGVGIKYKPNDKESFLKAVEFAKKVGSEYFADNLRSFQKKFSFAKVSREFSKVVKKTFDLQ